MELRDLLPADRSRLEAMVKAIPAFRDDDVAVALELIDDRLAKGEASDYEFVVGAERGHLLGYACFGRVPLTLSSFDLYWIVVAPQRQGQGIGSRLMEAVRQRVVHKGGQRIYVDTSSSEPYARTRRFYLAQGFVEAARLPDFYRDGEAKVVYCLSLASQ